MIKKLAEDIAIKMISNKAINIDDKDFYIYGLELLLSKMLVYLMIFIISVITHTVFVSVLFTLSYVLLRQYSGGYHCKSAEMCMLVSVLIYLLFITAYKTEFIHLNYYLIGGSSIISFILVVLFSPISSPNKPITDEDRKKYHIISIIIAAVFLIMFFVFACLNIRQISYPISCSLIADAILMIFTILDRRSKNDLECNSSSH